jgi:ABC-2 type transport system ATP-binding protein
MNAIVISGLCKQFKGKKMTRVDALKNLDLQVGQGEVFGFLGPNGAGKSTTIKILMGLLKASSGTAQVLGVDSSMTDARLHVGFLPENPAFYDYLSAEEYVTFVGSQFKMEPALLVRRTEDVLKRLDLWEARKRPMRSYSKGMVQRVGLAQTLVHDPEVYILDEPMSGLDPIGRALVKEIILELKKRGKCVFFSTHITDDVEKVCDRVGVIYKGELKKVDQVDSIITAGITGYILQVRKKDDSVEELRVDKTELNKTLEEISNRGDEIRLIEPKRKNLEDFFLEIVRNSES